MTERIKAPKSWGDCVCSASIVKWLLFGRNSVTLPWVTSSSLFKLNYAELT